MGSTFEHCQKRGDFPRMEHYKYKYILEVAQKQNLTRAAENLYISQSYLSRFITDVEKKLGLKLFDRSASPICLTYAGEKYVEYIRKILRLEKEMHSEILSIRKPESEVLTIGASNVISSGFLPYFLPQFCKSYPHVKIVIVEEGSSVLIDKLLDGKVDVAFVVPQLIPAEISYVLLMVRDLLLVAPEHHYLFQPESLHNLDCPLHIPKRMMTELKQEVFVIATAYQGVGVLTRKIFDHYRISPQIKLETKNLETAYRLSLGGMGLTIIPSLYCNFYQEPSDRVCYYNIGDPPFQWSLAAAFRNSKNPSPTIENFVRLAKNSSHLYI